MCYLERSGLSCSVPGVGIPLRPPLIFGGEAFDPSRPEIRTKHSAVAMNILTAAICYLPGPEQRSSRLSGCRRASRSVSITTTMGSGGIFVSPNSLGRKMPMRIFLYTNS